MREIIRAGIDSIDKGQMEAAKSLGMRYGLAMRRIVLPQAARVIVPPLGNEFNNMLKTTSLVFTIGVYEMFADAEIGYSNTFQPVEFFVAVAFWYLVLTTIWSVHPGLDRAQARRERARRRAHASASGSSRPGRVPAGACVQTMSDVVMEAVDVHKRFGRLEVLKGVSLDVAEGRDRLHHRPVRLRQDDVHPLHQPPREDRRGPDHRERPPDRLPARRTASSSRTRSGTSRSSARRSAWSSSASTSSRT